MKKGVDKPLPLLSVAAEREELLELVNDNDHAGARTLVAQRLPHREVQRPRILLQVAEQSSRRRRADRRQLGG